MVALNSTEADVRVNGTRIIQQVSVSSVKVVGQGQVSVSSVKVIGQGQASVSLVKVDSR